MKRIGWTAILLAVALLIAGCSKSDTGTNGDTDDGKPKSAAGTDSLPPPEKVEVPKHVDGGKVTDAFGKALLKGFAGSSGEAEPGDAPAFNP